MLLVRFCGMLILGWDNRSEGLYGNDIYNGKMSRIVRVEKKSRSNEVATSPKEHREQDWSLEEFSGQVLTAW